MIGYSHIAPIDSIMRILAAALLIVPVCAGAAALGRLTVHSSLGRPLDAEVEIVAIAQGEQESLAANIAAADAYRRAQLTPIPQPDALRAAVERNANGEYVVRLRSTAPLDQPLVNALVQLSWAGGAAMRQYSFLVDTIERGPPRVAATAPAAMKEAARAPAQTPVAKVNVPRAAAAMGASGAHTVQPGETLFKIARERHYPGVTVPQMVIAIHRANPAAFVDGSMDRLKVGQTLRIPDRAIAAAVTADEARQLADKYRAAPERARNEAREAKRGVPQNDDAAAADRGLAESRDRIGALEQTVSGLRELIDAKDRQIKELERQRAGQAAAKAPR